MRLLAFNPLLFTLSGILTSVQQTMGRFFFFAIAPLFYNVSIIVSIFIFKDNIGLVGLGAGRFDRCHRAATGGNARPLETGLSLAATYQLEKRRFPDYIA